MELSRSMQQRSRFALALLGALCALDTAACSWPRLGSFAADRAELEGVSEEECRALLGQEENVGAVRAAVERSRRYLERLPGDEPVSLNLWGFTPSLFPELERGFERFLAERGGDPEAEFYLPAAVDAALGARRAEVSVLPTEEEWFGVTYREDLPRVRAAVAARVAAGLYPRPLWG